MSPVILLSIVLQIACGVHVVRSGRPMYWLFILFIGSFIAVVIYVVAEVLPELCNSPTARKAIRNARGRLDPHREKRRAAARLDLADTADNRLKLAAESFNSGDFAQAEALYRSALQGLYKTDPEPMLGLAKAQFAQGQAREAKETLDALIAANPTYRSHEGHLLFARALEAMGDIKAALFEYEALAQGYPGEEGRARYAMLLQRDGQPDAARAVFADMLKRAAAAPGYYRREQREWIDLAKREARG